MEEPTEPEVAPVGVSEAPKSRRILLLSALVSGPLLIALILLYLLNRSPQSPPTTPPTPPTAQVTAKPELKLFASGLTDPTAIASTNQVSDRRLFVASRDGLIRIVDQNGQVAAQPFLDISSQTLAKGEMGLLGLAFSPNYSRDGYFFVNYIDKGQNTVIARYHVSADAAKTDVGSQQVVLTLKQPYQNHNGGDLAFGPDGYLYAALGDGGAAGDPQNRAQNLNSLFGKILRLDVKQLPYKIPPSNPFYNQAGKAGEVWDYGLRNPWRISFDQQTHELYIADVGQDRIEEVNLENPSHGGNNYGWRCFEGSLDYNLLGCSGRSKYVFPIIEYNHEQGRCSITGGYVYRGGHYPVLRGKYFYADFCGGQLYWSSKQNGKWQSNLAMTSPYQISTFGQDSQSELYAADLKTGNIYHLENAGP